MVEYNSAGYIIIDKPKYIKQEPYVGDDGIYVPCQPYMPEGSTANYICILTKEQFVEAYNKWIKDEVEYKIDEQILASSICDHDWEIIEMTETTGGTDYTYRCSKCGMIKKKCFDNSIYINYNSNDVKCWL